MLVDDSAITGHKYKRLPIKYNSKFTRTARDFWEKICCDVVLQHVATLAAQGRMDELKGFHIFMITDGKPTSDFEHADDIPSDRKGGAARKLS